MLHLITTLGPKRADELGMILPHEHVFVDLRTLRPARLRARPSRRCHRADGAGDRARSRRWASRRWSSARRSASGGAPISCAPSPKRPTSRWSCRPASIASRGCRPGRTPRAKTSCATGCSASSTARSSKRRPGRLDQAERRRRWHHAVGDEDPARGSARRARDRRRDRQPYHPRPRRAATSSTSSRRAATRPSASSGSTPAPSPTLALNLELAPARRLDRVRLDRRAGHGRPATSTASARCSTPASATGCCSATIAAGTTRPSPAAARPNPSPI